MTVFRARRRGNLLGGFTFGGRVAPGLGLILALTVGLTVASRLVTGLGELLALDSGALVHGELWRLVSWAFVATDPWSLLLGGLALWWTVPMVAYGWSTGRLLAVYLGFAAGAALVTALVFLPLSISAPMNVGWWPVIDGLMMLWALQNPDQQFSFWGVFPMTGRTFALLLVGLTVLTGIFAGGLSGLILFTPHFADLGFAWVATHGRLPTRRWRMQWRDFWSERSFRRKAKHLKVVRKDGQGPKQWLN